MYLGCFKPLGFERAQFSRLVPFTSIETNDSNESIPLTVQARCLPPPPPRRTPAVYPPLRPLTAAYPPP